MSQPQRNVVLGAIAVAAIVVAIVLFARGGAQSRAVPKDYTIEGVCLACREEAQITQPLGEYAPFPCPHCGKQAVYPWFYCYDCNRRFVPELVRPEPNGPLRLPMGPRCTACRSNHVGQYDPQWPTQHPIGDAPLPKWEQ